ncbi:zinc finger BED domain-containing protein RICESLEEPER 1-like [Phragmites australis]|uniref:zinc finger BED domain-containing protein RICESLEEPER 1-like n=1 Tax=Phragmites australis TaxID=29695 RepID=UPI002D780A88|nr:zinc finger BED domain-containing protein RICESLEEPER 1-like [Phragmites australis]
MEQESSQGRKQTPRRGRKLKPRSGVWAHFTRCRDDLGNDTGMAQCNRCKNQLNASYGTTSLKKHVDRCIEQEAAAAGVARPPPPPCAPSGSDGSTDPEPAGLEEEEEASRDLARMIALHGYDPSIVEDDYFKSFVRRLNPGFEVPSRRAIEQICDGIFDEARRDRDCPWVDDVPGKVSLAMGKAKTMEREVLYRACHFIDDDWNLHKVVADVKLDVPRPSYHGSLLVPTGQICVECEVDVEIISSYFLGLISDGDLFMIACGITNDHSKLKYDVTKLFDDTYAASRGLVCTTFMDNILHSVAQCLNLDSDFAKDMWLEGKELDLTRQEREKLLSRHGLDHLWAYDDGWWYSWYCSLEVLRKERSSRIRDKYLFIELLCNIWGAIYSAIQIISASSGPTSNLCLGELFNVRKVLQSELARASGGNANPYNGYNGFLGAQDVADVLKKAIDTLDKAIQDCYLVWSIPLVLDPRYKLSLHWSTIFNNAFGLEAANDYISQVTTKIEELYTDYIKGDSEEMYTGYTEDDSEEMYTDYTEDDREEMYTGYTEDDSEEMYFDYTEDDREEMYTDYTEDDRASAMAVDSADPSQQASDELFRYLNDCLVEPTQDFDILKWWKVHRSDYPTVARMARDALAMPTCSKLSSDQMAHVRSIIRGYSNKKNFK